MAGQPLKVGLNIGKYGWLRDLEARTAWKEGPLRTVYNTQKRHYEQVPLWEFHQLLQQGRIEELIAYSPYDGQEHKVYRLR
jgi:hypothetical protein